MPMFVILICLFGMPGGNGLGGLVMRLAIPCVSVQIVINVSIQVVILIALLAGHCLQGRRILRRNCVIRILQIALVVLLS